MKGIFQLGNVGTLFIQFPKKRKKKNPKNKYSGARVDIYCIRNCLYLTSTCAAFLVSSEQMCLFASHSVMKHNQLLILNK